MCTNVLHLNWTVQNPFQVLILVNLVSGRILVYYLLSRLQSYGTVSLNMPKGLPPSTLPAFKGLLRNFLIHIPDMPPSIGYTGVNHNYILDWPNTSKITESDFVCISILYKGVPC